MKIEQVFTGAFSAGQSKSHTIGKGHVNGLLLRVASLMPGHRITIKRRGESGTTVLCANMALEQLRRISGLEFGFEVTAARSTEVMLTYLDAVTAAVDDGTTNDVRSQLMAAHGMQSIPMFYIDLGSNYLGPKTELEMTLTFDSAWPNGQSYPVACYTVSRERVPDFMYLYDESRDMEAHHSNVDTLFVSSLGGFLVNTETGAAKDITVQVNDDEGAYLTDLFGLIAATNIFSQVEAYAVTDIVKAYRRRDAIPANLHVKVTGADVSAVQLVIRKVIYEQQATSSNTVEELRKLTDRVAKLEREDPATAKALRHAGAIPKSEEAAAVATATEVKQAADTAPIK